jgi:glycosyltransferase involved in cell wall biosynthesis
MRVLFLSAYWPPESGPPQARNFETARRLMEWGHEVSVLTAFPNHPTGVIPKTYRGKLFARETMDGMAVLRTLLYPAPNRGFWRWAAKHMSFAASALAASPLAGRADIIVVGSASLFLGASAYVISRMRGIPWVMTVADLWPATAVAQGRLTNPTLIRLAEGLESFVYNHAGCVVAVTQAMCQHVIETGVPPERVAHIPNGADTEIFRPDVNGREKRSSFGVDGKFVVMYAGSLGPAHGLDAVLDAAKLMRDDDDVRFVLVGEGSVKEELMSKASREKIENVSFVGRQPLAEMPSVLNAADVVIVPQRRSEFFGGVVPYKTAEAMACARPVVMASVGEAAAILKDAGAGLVVPPEDPAELAAAIRSIKSEPETAERMGRAGRAYAVEHLDRTKLARRMEEVLLRLVEANRRPAEPSHARV